MFTSRAEYRLLLRQDNADLRLTQRGREIGLASALRAERVQAKQAEIERVRMLLETNRREGKSLAHFLKMPQVTWADLPEEFQTVSEEIQIQVETDIRYAGYIQREMAAIEKARSLEGSPIPEWVDYDQIQGLKTEARLKLKTIRPQSFGQAGRISGINPSDIALVSIWVHKQKELRKAGQGTKNI
jgi:tRNA uridine 5-carboxymethylaminomethyl modification enzyme